jgi:hypothetical protein
MRTPRHLLRDLITLNPAKVGAEGESGAPEWDYNQTPTYVMGRLQPLSASDSMVYGRETGITIYQLFIDPIDIKGNAVAFTDAEWKTMQVVKDGLSYRVDGPARDPDSDGCLLVLNLERIA